MPDDVNIIDIARLSGVSVSTVSRVLNNHPDVSKKTKESVLRIIEKYSYVPNNSARNLKRESMKAIGVIVKGFTNPFFTRMLEIVQAELESSRYVMLLHQIDPNQDEIDAAISLVKEKKPRGLIFMGGNFMQNAEKLSKITLPFVMATVTINEGIERAAFSSVTIDDYRESYRVIDKICKSGHKNVAAIGFMPEDKSVSRLRIEGFKQAMLDNGNDCDGKIQYTGEFSLQAGYDAAKMLMEHTKFTCLFCISDVIALGALRAIHDAGYKVPEDISVVGFDGIESGRFSIPSLTTVKQPEQDMAHKAVSLLMKRLRNGAAHEHVVFEASYREGESFSPLKA